ncbi:terpene synthase 04, GERANYLLINALOOL SYNTHASE, TERPENE SYNTHASE 4 [Hibiscus trionum]|uniref:Terpene synthase 04, GERANYLLINALOOL SYNTHASE, TERPENE SYNTHASE 4 n=1 Tax=Hibiscus trionum TaxID=183268 RepID=A0A9W7LZT8_HIBTR|nr:terpene synthase 04, GERANYLLINALOOL SYNTHASE, TERPENE SYNTHASE 4 [Hibiscus trionum]
MELSKVSIETLVKRVNEEMMLSDIDPYSFVSPSAYDTAWLAMVPADSNQMEPMFKDCLDWVLNNQTKQGFWGESDAHDNPTLESLPATLACVVALNKWNTGRENAEKGLAFIRANAEKLLGGYRHQFPPWFAIVFPGMIELARKTGIHLDFPNHLQEFLMDVFSERQRILESETVGGPYPPLLSYLEALPSFYSMNEEDISMNLKRDGSLFQSPSATARAFMATGNKDCLAYLQSLVKTFANNGVPPTYPMDEELVKLGLVNQLQRLGLAEHFTERIEDILSQVYKNYRKELPSEKSCSVTSVATQLQKDSLAFRLLRMHGYSVSPWSLCWFLNDHEILDHIEKNHEFFASIMLNVHRATDIIFPGEYELEEARSFSRKVLEKVVTKGTGSDNDPFTNSSNFQRMIEHELSLPWVARLDHLEHRAWIEENEMNALWPGKTSFHRLSSAKNEMLVQLAAADFEFRQLIYKKETAELKSWCLKWGLSNMGFGRERTMYCYFAISSCLSLPYDSDIRMVAAKSAILITVADDFFDMKGSLDELNILTDAVRRWDGRGLSGHSKVIFDALDNLVKETAEKHLQQQGTDTTCFLKQIWVETFDSWLVEAKWSKTGSLPSTDEYLRNGMTSIAAHTVVLPAACFLKSSSRNADISLAADYETVTKLTMLIPRLLNDIQSYQKEMEDGKMNYVMLYMKENPDAGIDDSIAFIRDLLDNKRKELMKHALMDGLSGLPMESRQLHLSCMKVFQMFFNSSNRYDSNTEMIQDIQKAIYVPLDVGTCKPQVPLPSQPGSKKEFQTIGSHQLVQRHFKYQNKRIVRYQASLPIARRGHANTFIGASFSLSFA